jgi:hypothetical protein
MAIQLNNFNAQSSRLLYNRYLSENPLYKLGFGIKSFPNPIRPIHFGNRSNAEAKLALICDQFPRERSQ